ncbi:MAG: hypothetical protein HDT47_05105 [Ruminococcaceae bacterium]|nr:hypothetical protein [Oscillospiraceae bacterium]
MVISINEKRLASELKQGSTAALGEIIDEPSGYVCTVARNFSRGTLSEDEIDELSGEYSSNSYIL